MWTEDPWEFTYREQKKWRRKQFWQDCSIPLVFIMILVLVALAAVLF